MKMNMNYNDMTAKELASEMGLTESTINYHKRNGKSHNDIVQAHNDRQQAQQLNAMLADARDELEEAKILAQIDTLRLQSVDRKLKIMQKMGELVHKDKVDQFVLKLSGILKSTRSIAYSDVPSRAEGLDAKQIGKILLDAAKKMDELILTELSTAQQELADNDR